MQLNKAADIDVFIVTYHTSTAQLTQLLSSLVMSQADIPVKVHIWDNSVDRVAFIRINETALQFNAQLGEIEIIASATNMGFGKANNMLLNRSQAELVLLLNPDTALLPGSLKHAVERARTDTDACAFEFRQTPFEHPKNYHAASYETSWVSGAAVLFRRAALASVGGFEPQLFLYGEDVDLSWRLRARGFILRYLPHAPVLHETYKFAGEVKPQQVFGSTLANLCLRARYGGFEAWWTGVKMLMLEIRRPDSFPGRRKGLLKNLVKAILKYRYFSSTRVLPSRGFTPIFAAWDYEHRRKGAFHQLAVPTEFENQQRVSILIRTHKRPSWLREALNSALAQTHKNIEVIVVEDGQDTARSIIESEYAQHSNIKYHATGTAVGRSAAGNIALGMASGDWLNFLDDDDLLYPDHVQTLLQDALAQKLPAVYGVAWEQPTDLQSLEPLVYQESAPFHRYMTPFSHLELWRSNFMPIQTVLFHRKLYERHGGFETDMDQLEDWNLWTRYALADRFAIVDKTTSVYRVPSLHTVKHARQEALDAAYLDAIARQRLMKVELDPQTILQQLPGWMPTFPQSAAQIAAEETRTNAHGTPGRLRRALEKTPLVWRFVPALSKLRRALPF
jgi:GT2 family glycosyltransferase